MNNRRASIRMIEALLLPVGAPEAKEGDDEPRAFLL
jgi:hypothetical protein